MCNIWQFNRTSASSAEEHNWDSIVLLSLGFNISWYHNKQQAFVNFLFLVYLIKNISLSLDEHEFTIIKFDCKQLTPVLKSMIFSLVGSLTENRIKFKLNFTAEITEINRSISSLNLLMSQVKSSQVNQRMRR